MISLNGPIMYVKGVFEKEKGISHVVHLFGDIHSYSTQCKEPRVELTTLVENTLRGQEQVDVFVETGFGDYTYGSHASIPHTSNPYFQPRLGQVYPMMTHTGRMEWRDDELTLLNRNYLDNFIHYFASYHDCFLRPRQETCSNHFPRARFHSIDMRMTLWYESTHCFLGLFPSSLTSCVDISEYVGKTLQAEKQVVEHARTSSGKERSILIWIHSLLHARLTRLRVRHDTIPLTRNDLFLLAIDQTEFIKDLWWCTVVQSFPLPDTKQLNQGEPPYPIYRLLHHVNAVTEKLRPACRSLIRSSIQSIIVSHQHVPLSYLSHVSERDSVYADTAIFQDLFTLIRTLRDDVKHVIVYAGANHIHRFLGMIKSIQRESVLVWKESTVFGYDELRQPSHMKHQCISIPVDNDSLSFSSDVVVDPARIVHELSIEPVIPSSYSIRRNSQERHMGKRRTRRTRRKKNNNKKLR